ncbi:hypothetical protein ANCDUO_18599 [Ancylostoma duodenale]|uniref:Uncharacterized protein n=1 Tax=Ancylostoma duodenale TaxID=51022 RepID=A0A0C2G2Q0_9BILA|nr:hypothetical protein ANCDUO_18599 [Ancylostoma duodenale]
MKKVISVFCSTASLTWRIPRGTLYTSNKNSTPTDEKANAKKQSLLFRHFNTLLGFSNTEKCFTIPPARLR